MWWARALIFGIPLAALGVGSWAAWGARMARQPKADEVVVMLPGKLPALNPLWPQGEPERQMLDLLHEPLVRVGRDGAPSPGLAQEWRWQRLVTCWFDTPELAQQAASRLQALSGNVWLAGQLEGAAANGSSVTMNFARPDDPGADDALRRIADLKPQRLTVIQTRGDEKRHELLATFAKVPAAGIKRLWFDGVGTLEMVTALPADRFQRMLTDWLQTRKEQPVTVRTVAELSGLAEPVLEFRMNPKATWPDEKPVTAEDVRATMAWAVRRGVMGFEQLQAVEPAASGWIRVVYRTQVGSALAAWMQLPILPAEWLTGHAEPWTEMPPGAGPYRLAERGGDGLTLEPSRAAESGADPLPRLRVVEAAPPLKTHLAVSTKGLDVLWPTAQNEAAVRERNGFEFEAAPARNRLLILWNTRSPVLRDPQVREALAMGTDRSKLVADLLDGRGRVVEGWFQKGLWFSQNLPEKRGDFGRAERLLAEAGWLKDVSGVAKTANRRLEMELLITEGSPERRRLAEALAQQWAKLGARVQIAEVAASELVGRRLRTGQFDAVLLGLDYELGWDQRAFWRSRGDMNFSGLADEKLDLLLDALATEHDTKLVGERAKAAEDQLLSLHAFMPLFTDLQEVAVRRQKFPESPEPALGLTLRHLLVPQPERTRQAPPPNLKMIVPDE